MANNKTTSKVNPKQEVKPYEIREKSTSQSDVKNPDVSEETVKESEELKETAIPKKTQPQKKEEAENKELNVEKIIFQESRKLKIKFNHHSKSIDVHLEDSYGNYPLLKIAKGVKELEVFEGYRLRFIFGGDMKYYEL